MYHDKMNKLCVPNDTISPFIASTLKLQMKKEKLQEKLFGNDFWQILLDSGIWGIEETVIFLEPQIF